MDPLPRHLLPLSFSSQVLKNLPVAADARVLPGVDDLAGLAEAIKACALSVAVIGPDWPREDLVAAQEMLLDHAVACVVATELDPVWLEPAIVAALAERTNQFESIFLSQLLPLLPDLVYFKDRYGRFLAANHELARSVQLDDPALLIGRSDADFLSADYAQKTLADEQAIMRTGQPVIALSERATYDGNRVKWWLTWKCPLRDRSGRVIGTFGFSRDETAFKTTEMALETERHLLEVLLTRLPDSVYIKDREGRFLLANQVIANRMGVTQAFLRGKRDVDLYPPELAAGFRKDEEAIMATGMPLINREEMILGADGREIHILTTKLPYRNAAGEVIGIIGMGRNITLRKGFDEQMKLAHEEIVKLRAEVAATAELRAETVALRAELAQLKGAGARPA
ncbi:MAG: PAS domain-containing protein [Opitutus sp.]|nr:PAS domain-containing protein [Opitutus sp.]MCS6246233.1 PAS domain-containing protein [Opitutus sp.]MCS6275347.1 PAS domain-containing protein [Opitutus sp.]MCS6277240.1 PAS domain-containing protein [Opitutus sp.]MCS6300362.1 PAS domain-containing protein [Opitutus sp.]